MRVLFKYLPLLALVGLAAVPAVATADGTTVGGGGGTTSYAPFLTDFSVVNGPIYTTISGHVEGAGAGDVIVIIEGAAGDIVLTTDEDGDFSITVKLSPTAGGTVTATIYSPDGILLDQMSDVLLPRQ
jgi:hypothetical protein